MVSPHSVTGAWIHPAAPRSRGARYLSASGRCLAEKLKIRKIRRVVSQGFTSRLLASARPCCDPAKCSPCTGDPANRDPRKCPRSEFTTCSESQTAPRTAHTTVSSRGTLAIKGASLGSSAVAEEVMATETDSDKSNLWLLVVSGPSEEAPKGHACPDLSYEVKFKYPRGKKTVKACRLRPVISGNGDASTRCFQEDVTLGEVYVPFHLLRMEKITLADEKSDIAPKVRVLSATDKAAVLEGVAWQTDELACCLAARMRGRVSVRASARSPRLAAYRPGAMRSFCCAHVLMRAPSLLAQRSRGGGDLLVESNACFGWVCYRQFSSPVPCVTHHRTKGPSHHDPARGACRGTKDKGAVSKQAPCFLFLWRTKAHSTCTDPPKFQYKMATQAPKKRQSFTCGTPCGSRARDKKERRRASPNHLQWDSAQWHRGGFGSNPAPPIRVRLTRED